MTPSIYDAPGHSSIFLQSIKDSAIARRNIMTYVIQVSKRNGRRQYTLLDSISPSQHQTRNLEEDNGCGLITRFWTRNSDG